MLRYIILLSILTVGCSSTDTNHYQFSSPDAIFELPKKLTEISGIATSDDQTLICVEDEHGILYRYNLIDKKIQSEVPFAGKGDYEDIALKGDTTYVLRSDGVIVEITNNESSAPYIREIQTGLDKVDAEGLWYSPNAQLLFIASKSHGSIYTFDLRDEKIKEKPIKIHLYDTFAPSAIAIHPISNEFYFLSSIGKKLVIASREGTVKKVFHLPEHYFKQPEGITFNSAGDLYISNEGKDGRANILLFKYQK